MNASQLKFHLPPAPGLLPGEIIVDLFAGAGGASRGIEMALGRSPNIAVNHDDLALQCHQVNHPATRHLRENVWKVNPREVTFGVPVGLLWASPDCRHFSRAKGGKPVSRRVRSLANVVVKWAKYAQPRVIALENVMEFQTWGPVDKKGKPIKARKGEYFRRWKSSLERKGYVVEHRVLVAADFGAPTSRKRFFMVARRDGVPIRWPEPTHGAGRPEPWRTAAECIDWSLPCPSIFERKKPLAEATLRRIARGVVRYVLNDPKPFIVNLTHGGRVEGADEPMRTVTGAHRGEKALIMPSVLTNTSGHPGRRADGPLPTVATGGHHALVGAFLAKHYGGVVGQPVDKTLGTITAKDHHSLAAVSLVKHYGQGTGQKVGAPAPTVTVGGMDHTGLLAAHLTKFRGDGPGRSVREPAPTIVAGHSETRPGGNGHKLGLVAASLTKFYGTNTGARVDEPAPTVTGKGQHLGLVAAFLAKYYGTAIGQKPGSPLHAVTSKDRFGVVTVNLEGEEYALVDIGMRMLQPHELAAAQGFDPEYVILGNKSEQVRLIGNSVPPQLSEAVIRANLVENVVAREAIA